MGTVTKLPVKFRQQLVTDSARQSAPKAVKPSKTYLRHKARIEGKSPLTKTEIQSFCWVLNGSKKTAVTADERYTLLFMVDSDFSRPITAEQTALGIDWLKRTAFRLNGDARTSSPFTFEQHAIIRDFARFAWVGVYNSADDRYPHYTPVWRVFDSKGNHFDYHVSGGYGGTVIDSY